MKRIAVDMDEVLADALSEHLARYNRDHGEAITKDQLEGKWLWDIVSADRHERLRVTSAVKTFSRTSRSSRIAKTFSPNSANTTKSLLPPRPWSSLILLAPSIG